MILGLIVGGVKSDFAITNFVSILKDHSQEDSASHKSDLRTITTMSDDKSWDKSASCKSNLWTVKLWPKITLGIVKMC